MRLESRRSRREAISVRRPLSRCIGVRVGPSLLALSCAGVLTGCGMSSSTQPASGSNTALASHTSTHAVGSVGSSRPPAAPGSNVLAQYRGVLEAQRGMPKRVLVAAARQQRAAVALLHASESAPASASAGCVAGATIPKTFLRSHHLKPRPPEELPPAPVVHPVIIGHQVEIQFSFSHWPSSLACRPIVLQVLIYSGQDGTSSFKNGQGSVYYKLNGPRGRVVDDLTWDGRPPYHLAVESVLPDNAQSRTVGGELQCPGTRSSTKGCLAGRQLTFADENALPTPVLPTHGLTSAQLARSVVEVTANQDPAPREVACASLHTCTLTYVDSVISSKPYTVRYRIGGQQLAGCWMAQADASDSDVPRWAYSGESDLAGCRHWPN